MNKNIERISHYGDILAIPFFILLSMYFYSIEDKNPLEYLLFVFSVVGFFMDTLFTFFYFL